MCGCYGNMLVYMSPKSHLQLYPKYLESANALFLIYADEHQGLRGYSSASATMTPISNPRPSTRFDLAHMVIVS